MFQVAHTVCQGLKYNVQTVFPKFSFIAGQGNQPTKYLDTIFKKINFSEKFTISEVVLESSFNEPNISFDPQKNLEFQGYFQSSQNFLGFDENIIELFSPPSNFIFEKIFTYPTITLPSSVSVHFRRGDYKDLKSIHPTISLSYVEKCIREIGGIEKIFVFSDDKEWMKKTFNEEKYTIIDNLEDYEELWMMSLFRNNILSPSSFSWWSAFLNRNKNKKIFVPNIWFGENGPHPYDNVFEKNWIKIQVENRNGVLFC